MKKKMSSKRYRAIMIPLLSILGVFALAASIGMNMFASSMEMFFGKGSKNTVAVQTVVDGDTDYYKSRYTSAEESVAAGYEVARQVFEEGCILLKNSNALPLEKKANVMPFGYAYLNPIYGQVDYWGSGKWVTEKRGIMNSATDPTTPAEALDGFQINNSAVEAMNNAKPVTLSAAEETTDDGGKWGSVIGSSSKLTEYDASIYNDIAPVDDTTALVFITRSGEEGVDKKMDGYSDGTPHYLALSENEKNTIKEAKRICGKAVVILVSSAPLELAPIMDDENGCEADGILWVGHPGEKGFDSLAEILDGEISPSGRTPDIYVRDFLKDPSAQNVGTFTYTREDNPDYSSPYVEYQEGMYVGYRYYETANDIQADGFTYGTLKSDGGVQEKGEVCYPFGYGLSYSEFEQEIVDYTEDEDTVSVKVKVTNIGNTAAKDVVQLYYTAPYTQLDMDYHIEKPTVNLIAFDKTEILEANGGSEIVELSFEKEDMASYCYTHENEDGTKGCYMLEEGDYIISLRKNSHDVIDQRTCHLDETFWYDGSDTDHIRKTDLEAQSAMDENGNVSDEPANGEAYFAVTNQFQTMSDYMEEESTGLSRADWNGTLPDTQNAHTKELSDTYYKLFQESNDFDYNTDKLLGNTEESQIYAEEQPAGSADNGMTLSDMRGKDYYDSDWDKLLDQIDWDADEENIRSLFTLSAYKTVEVPSIGLMSTTEYDGCNGVKVPKGTSYDMAKSTTFEFAPMLSATWNIDLIYKVGEAIADDALTNGITGLYSPAVNLHRSPFNGRVFEYYSEDPYLSGKIASAFISGAGDRGMICYLKHFALNDSETNRDAQLHTWANEQVIRELYLKAFEIPVKEAKMTIQYLDENGTTQTRTMRATTGCMASQNQVGTVYGHDSYALLTTVLRKEWGFQGVVVSDYFDNEESNRDFAMRAGCDTYLSANNKVSVLHDYDSATARSAMRNAIHNLCYAVVNSNAMENVAPGETVTYSGSNWRIYLYLFDAAAVTLIILGIVSIKKRKEDEKKNPDKYRRKEVV